MSYSNYFFRKIINHANRLRLKNKTFSLFASNCNGCCICHDLGLQFRSPFVNLCLNAEDYIKFLENPKDYLYAPLEFLPDTGKTYPVGVLKDISLHFMHYESSQDAQKDRKSTRLNSSHPRISRMPSSA